MNKRIVSIRLLFKKGTSHGALVKCIVFVGVCVCLAFFLIPAALGAPYCNNDKIEDALYMFAIGDYKQSKKFLLSLESDEAAQLQLGFIYYHGMGGEKDIENAVKWLKKSAESDNPEALYWLGTIYLEEPNYTNKRSEGVGLLKRSAFLGCFLAQKRLGEMLFWGEGIQRNYQKSFVFNYMAAIRGVGISQYLLSIMYWKGLGVKPEIKKFIYWLKEAAKSNNAKAQYELASLYYFGEYLKKDVELAKRYFNLSLVNGYEPSEQALSDFFGDE